MTSCTRFWLFFVFNAIDSPFLCNRVSRSDYGISTTQRKFTPYDMKATVGACATVSESRETGGWGKRGERRGVVGPANLAITRVYVRTYVRKVESRHTLRVARTQISEKYWKKYAISSRRLQWYDLVVHFGGGQSG